VNREWVDALQIDKQQGGNAMEGRAVHVGSCSDAPCGACAAIVGTVKAQQLVIAGGSR